VRDTLLNYLRSQTYETIADNKHKQAMAQEMLDAVHKVGGDAVTAVLIQDLIVQ
jgi:flagellar basal body-associated protein FliL